LTRLYYCTSPAPTPVGYTAPTPHPTPSAPTPNPTSDPTLAPTRAPTPVPHFRRGRPKLVRRTLLRGFTRESFTNGFQTVFRRAFAKRLGRAVADVIITNIRDANANTTMTAANTTATTTAANTTATTTTATAAGGGASRALASAAQGVTFDVQVAADTTAAVAALQQRVTGANSSVSDSAVVAAFEVELSAVVQSGEFEDVSGDLVMDGAALEVVAGSTTTAVETGAPTPAPPPDGGAGDGASPLVPALVGAVALVALVGAVAWRRRASGPSVGAGGGTKAVTSGSATENPMAKVRGAVAGAAAAQQQPTAQLPTTLSQQNVNSALPPGWEACTDEASGHPYYYNGRTGETSWELPGEFSSQ
jgi:hypothetical protein